MNDAEKQLKLEETMRALAEFLDKQIEEEIGKHGFILILFEFNKKGGLSNYVSNAALPDVVKALRNAAKILEAGEFIPVSHGTVQ